MTCDSRAGDIARSVRRRYKRIGYVAAGLREARVVDCLREFYDVVDVRDGVRTAVDLLIVIGGDGLMLHSLHNHVIEPRNPLPVYGIKCGTVGFLLNHHSGDDLARKVEEAVATKLVPLRMSAVDIHGNAHHAIAVNEVSLFRGTHQAAKLKIRVNGESVMEQLVSDGIMVATPAGSTAYNFSAGGPILPLESNVISLTAINSFRPRRWRGALLPNGAVVEVEVLDPEARLVGAVADYTEFCNVKSIEIRQDTTIEVTLMFDPEHRLEERTFAEQFLA